VFFYQSHEKELKKVEMGSDRHFVDVYLGDGNLMVGFDQFYFRKNWAA
jgi:hypothetical protein